MSLIETSPKILGEVFLILIEIIFLSIIKRKILMKRKSNLIQQATNSGVQECNFALQEYDLGVQE